MGVGRPRPSGGFELAAWFFMRVSGLLLLFLAMGHLCIMHLIHSVDVINFDFVADRWAGPFWRGYDWLMLTLALLHGCNGLRTVIEDYVHKPVLRRSLLWLTALTLVLFVGIGSWIIFAFDAAAFAR